MKSMRDSKIRTMVDSVTLLDRANERLMALQTISDKLESEITREAWRTSISRELKHLSVAVKDAESFPTADAVEKKLYEMKSLMRQENVERKQREVEHEVMQIQRLISMISTGTRTEFPVSSDDPFLLALLNREHPTLNDE